MGSSVSPNQRPFENNRYEWLEYFGGNMADVYLAREVRTDRKVIVKVLKTEYCGESDLQVRFAQEARLACQCQHPNIVATYYADEQDGRPYIAMEYLQGETIRALIQRGGIETQEKAVWIALQLALALGYLQTAQIVHRDLKPDNVVVDDKDCAKLLDFGVARLKDSNLTEIGVRIGTLKYMSPEQVKGEALTFSSDMYALGVLLFEMLTFKLPYQADGMEGFFEAIVLKEPNLALLHDAKVPSELSSIIKRCLEKDPAHRFPSFSELATALRPFVQPERLQQLPGSTVIMQPVLPPQKKSLLPIILGSVAAVLLVVVIAIWFLKLAPTKTETAAIVNTPPRLLTFDSGDMVLVDGGHALLGEKPIPVQVKGFYIDKTEVTTAAYLQFCQKTSHAIPDGVHDVAPNLPVVRVSFDDAKAFAAWAHKRLPTADEWEKAARGDKGQKFPWGDVWKDDAANLPSDQAARKTSQIRPASSYFAGASPYGALNLLGNVWEWVDTKAAEPDDRQFNELLKDYPRLTKSEPFYETKGGSFKFVTPKGQEAALVFDNNPLPARATRSDLGFRCAKDL